MSEGPERVVYVVENQDLKITCACGTIETTKGPVDVVRAARLVDWFTRRHRLCHAIGTGPIAPLLATATKAMPANGSVH